MSKTKYYQAGSKFNHLIKTNEDLKKPAPRKGLLKPKTKTQADVVKEQIANGYTSIDPFEELLDAPSKSATYLLSGKYEMPSDALNIKNPIGKFATDAVLDPTNLLGVGLLSKLGKVDKAADAVSTVNKADKLVLGNLGPNKPKIGNYFKNTEIAPVDMVKKFEDNAAERLKELASPEGRRRLEAFAGEELTDAQHKKIVSNVADTRYSYVDSPDFTGSHASTSLTNPFMEKLRNFIRGDALEKRNSVFVNNNDTKNSLGVDLDGIWNHEHSHVVTNSVERVLGERPMDAWAAGIEVGKNKTLPEALNSNVLKDPIKGEMHDYLLYDDEFPSHLSELRSALKRDGVIKNNYDHVSDEKMIDYINNKIATDPANQSRMDYIMRSHYLNDKAEGLRSFSEIMKRYNRLPALVPGMVGAGVVANEVKKKKYYKGGKLLDKTKGS